MRNPLHLAATATVTAILTLAGVTDLAPAQLAQPAATRPATGSPAQPGRPQRVPAAIKPAKGPAAEWARNEVQRVLDALSVSNDFDAASNELTQLFDGVVRFGGDDALATLPEIARAGRVVAHLSACDEAVRQRLLPLLRANPALADALAFAVADGDDVPAAYGVLDALRERHASKLNDFANLAAAICVVRDRPLAPIIAERPDRIADPVELFDYFTRAEKQMFFGVRDVPAALLAYVVDTTTPLPDLAWALDRYRGNRQIGQRFFEIRYDDQAYAIGSKVQVRDMGYSLRDILRMGGVCADQAYFATAVGKAIGVPTAFCHARDGDVGHAWVGYLERLPGGVRWNFDSGRYESYRGIRGLCTDPQTGKEIPDAYVSLLAELAASGPEERALSQSLTDAALWIGQLSGGNRPATASSNRGSTATAAAPAVATPADPKSVIDSMTAAGLKPRPQARPASVNEQLALLNLAINACPGSLRPWLEVVRLAEDDRIPAEQKQAWTKLVGDLYGNRYPDLTLALLDPMVRSIKDPKAQDRAWESVFRMFPNRQDLSAEVRLRQGELWTAAGDRGKAMNYYTDVVNRYAASGRSAVDAIKAMEKLLVDGNRRDQVLPMYARFWPKMQRPNSAVQDFARQSNWYVVGEMYADRLQFAGQRQQAEAVRLQLLNAVRFGDDDDNNGGNRRR